MRCESTPIGDAWLDKSQLLLWNSQVMVNWLE